jgi:hypothetical protein
VDEVEPKTGNVSGKKRMNADVAALTEFATRFKATAGRRSEIVRERKLKNETAEAEALKAQEKQYSARAKKVVQSRTQNNAMQQLEMKVQIAEAAKREKDAAVLAQQRAAQVTLNREREEAKRREQDLLNQLAEAKSRAVVTGPITDSFAPGPIRHDVAARLHRLQMHEAKTNLARLKATELVDAEAAAKMARFKATQLVDAEARVSFLSQEEIINGYDRF